MKGEYAEHHHQPIPPKHEPSSHTATMFSKSHHLHQPPQQQLPFTHHFHLSRDSPTTDDTTETSVIIPTTTTTAITNINSADGATIEVARRPRGRPPGSKNKPKPPVIMTREPEPVMTPFILELPGGSDVVESLSRFCLRKNMALCVLAGTGAVANVTLRQPPTTSTITFRGRFDILSMSATVVPPQTTSQSATCPPHIPTTFTITLAGPQGHIVGGLVAGGLIAASTVYIIAASLKNPSFHRLSGGGGGEEATSGSGTGDGEGQSPVSGGGGGGGGESGCNAPRVESGMYSSVHGFGSADVIWAPTARPPQQQPPPPY